jgi:hypothetical protein
MPMRVLRELRIDLDRARFGRIHQQLHLAAMIERDERPHRIKNASTCL